MTFKELQKTPKGTILNMRLDIPGWSEGVELVKVIKTTDFEMTLSDLFNGEPLNLSKGKKKNMALVKTLDGGIKMVEVRKLWKK